MNYAKVFARFRNNNIELILKFDMVEMELIKEYITANSNTRTGIKEYLCDICYPLTIVDFFAMFEDEKIKIDWENPDSLSKMKKKNIMSYL